MGEGGTWALILKRFGFSIHPIEVSAKNFVTDCGSTARTEREISAKKNYSSELTIEKGS
jgi:hypothetical protein